MTFIDGGKQRLRRRNIRLIIPAPLLPLLECRTFRHMGAGRSGTPDSLPVNKGLIRTESAGPSGAPISCAMDTIATTTNCVHNPALFFPSLTPQSSGHFPPLISGNRRRNFYISVIYRRSRAWHVTC